MSHPSEGAILPVESAQISGKVFRFLSTMHPSLSKPERKRYSEFDPDKWYPWTPEIAGEFTDLMKRSPRDTSFARGLAYAATKALPEDTRLTPSEVVAGLASLPAAFQGPHGSGFEVHIDRPGHAEVAYRGMPGFSNVCIAIVGELTKRLQDVGARGLDVKHADGCRLQGADACRFEVNWAADPGETVEAEPAPAASYARMPEPAPPRAAERSRFEEPAPTRAAERSRFEEPEPPAPRTFVTPRPAMPAREPVSPPPPPSGNSAEDLFEQLRSRLVDAERQTARHNELESHIAALDARASELEAALADAQADAASARRELADLKRRLRELAG